MTIRPDENFVSSRRKYLQQAGVYARAAEAGLQLRPTELLIFGNARCGTPLMQTNQVVGLNVCFVRSA